MFVFSNTEFKNEFLYLKIGLFIPTLKEAHELRFQRVPVVSTFCNSIFLIYQLSLDLRSLSQATIFLILQDFTATLLTVSGITITLPEFPRTY